MQSFCPDHMRSFVLVHQIRDNLKMDLAVWLGKGDRSWGQAFGTVIGDTGWGHFFVTRVRDIFGDMG